MNKSTVLTLLVVVGSPLLFSGCVVSDGYYDDPYYYGSEVVIAPALPYEVYLSDRPYYSYGGYYYYYNNARWYYSRTRDGRWLDLPQSHWPRDTRWRGHHYYNDHRNEKYPSRPQKDSRPNNRYWHDQDQRRNDNYRRNDSRYQDSHRDNQPRPQADQRRNDNYRRTDSRSQDSRRDNQPRPQVDQRRDNRHSPQSAVPRRDETRRQEPQNQRQTPVHRSVDQQRSNDRSTIEQFKQDRARQPWNKDERQQPWR